VISRGVFPILQPSGQKGQFTLKCLSLIDINKRRTGRTHLGSAMEPEMLRLGHAVAPCEAEDRAGR
jgi:hypothetical protein